uniref:Uncharacterized protein n=1 Tax=Siphoviridae sp. ctHMI2 TaxID=2826231 RepID=A0A8S5MKJ5_9CAUD|nr:MAG TPA: hypothetical protein [Siphoviridae sp. ctHMI2]
MLSYYHNISHYPRAWALSLLQRYKYFFNYQKQILLFCIYFFV